VKTYCHPLQAYSPRYFTEGSGLPPSYSAANHDAAVAVLHGAAGDGDSRLSVVPFPLAGSGETVIDLDELVAFYSRPNNFLARKLLDIRIANPKYDLLSDDDFLGASVGDDFLDAVLLGRKSLDDFSIKSESERMVETGLAANSDQACTALEAELSMEVIGDFQSKVIEFARNSEEQRKFGCPNNPVVGEIRRFEETEPEGFSVGVSAKGRKAVVVGCHRPAVRLVNGAGDKIPYAFVYRRTFWQSDMIAAWIRHLVRQTESGGGGCVTALVSPEWKQVRILCPVPDDDARNRLANIVALAAEPMSVDLKKASGKDELPEELQTAVDSSGFLRYKGQRKK
jgi:hypothetical protein